MSPFSVGSPEFFGALATAAFLATSAFCYFERRKLIKEFHERHERREAYEEMLKTRAERQSRQSVINKRRLLSAIQGNSPARRKTDNPKSSHFGGDNHTPIAGHSSMPSFGSGSSSSDSSSCSSDSGSSSSCD